MTNFNFFTKKHLDHLLHKRDGETKFGEHIPLVSNMSSIYDSIRDLDVYYVIFGIAEDIGVYANYGHAGTRDTWDAVIKSLVNIQTNSYLNPKRVTILGHLDYSHQQHIIHDPQTETSISTARSYVEIIDADVTQLVSDIFKANKTPIIIGGGHNNSFGNIKGGSLALNKKLNVVNLDAHSDFRALEGRHSGNGFSYAYSQGYLNRYFMFGLHECYTSQLLFETINSDTNLDYNTFESLKVRQELDFNTELKTALNHINTAPFGLEIDCDAIEHIPSSAATPSGFSVTETRQFINYFAAQHHAAYLHICEAIVHNNASITAKLISFLITDFIKAHSKVKARGN